MQVWVQPRAKQAGVIGEQGDKLKIKVTSPPVDNRANAEILKILQDKLGLKKKDLEVVKGKTNREKLIFIKANEVDWEKLF
ncbi:MAG: DUF167 domain-containing protein [Desulfonauticus sp.]|nr:DUF167 domain-containing protein [Desulfonauticus sp.]